jgi:hypothetical protein
MKPLNINILFILIPVMMLACSPAQESGSKYLSEGPSQVEMRHDDGKYRLFVNGEEFYVKGAGCEFGPCYKIADHGGNSFRTWRTDNSRRSGMEVLDEAYEHGLMVMMGLDVARERHGFDYDDEAAVAAQLERFRQEVMELKNHPALLGWGIGNELNLRYTNPKVWDAVNDIARMIKEVDGNHITTTMLAGIGPNEVEYIAANCPDIDFLSIQMYGALINLEEILDNAGFDGPYLVTEWGPIGHWEMPQTEWGRPIEQTSTEKAEIIKERYQEVILADDDNCMGSFVFLWGQKQERTPSWYGFFTEEGESMEPVHMMEYLWTGEWPDQKAPQVLDINITGKGGRFDSVHLTSNGEYVAQIQTEHQDISKLTVRAEIMPEPKELSDGGDFEPRPESIEGLIVSTNTSEIIFKAPTEPGEYRILVYVTDEYNNAGTANLPFYVN